MQHDHDQIKCYKEKSLSSGSEIFCDADEDSSVAPGSCIVTTSSWWPRTDYSLESLEVMSRSKSQ